MKTFSAVLLTLAVAAAAPAVRAETTNCTPITSLPYTITVQGIYCFTGNLSTSITSGNAITIEANNVTLDMNGFKLGGLGAGVDTYAWGIAAFGRRNITIRNGIVRGFFYGIRLWNATSRGHVVEDVLADWNTFAGILIQGSGCVVRHNQVVATGGSTISAGKAIGIQVDGPTNDVLDNRVAGTANTDATKGIEVLNGDGSVVEGNRVSGDLGGTSAYGIFMNNSLDVLLANNRITTADGGIVFDVSSTGKYMENLTSGVTTPFIGGTAVGTND